MRDLQYQLFWQPEVLGPAPVDYRRGKSDQPKAVCDQIFVDRQAVLAVIKTGQGYANNDIHCRILDNYGDLQGGITLMLGPAGTAKTTLSANMLVLHLTGNYCSFVMGEQHAAVDNVAMTFAAIMEKVKKDLGPRNDIVKKLEGKKILRFETNGIPRSAQGLKLFLEEYNNVYVNQMDTEETFLQDPEVAYHFDLLQDIEAATEAEYLQEQRDERARIEEAILGVHRSYEAAEKMYNRRTVKCPYKYTMMFNLRRQREEDVANNQANLSDEWYALQMKLEKDEALTSEEAGRLRKTRLAQVVRVVRSADVIFTTISASADPLIMENAKPHFVHLEEATQIDVPSGCVASQHAPLHMFVVGDLQQIIQHKSSKKVNPAWNYIDLSFLHYLALKAVNVWHSEINYRLFPEMLKFITPNWYPSGLEAADCTKNEEAEARPARVAMRSHTKELGLVDKQNKRGYNHVMVDVPRGVCVKEDHGHSRVHDAEARSALAIMVNSVEKYGQKPEEVAVISFYRGQLTYLRDLFDSYGDKYAWHRQIPFLTADQSRGRTFGVTYVLGVATAINAINELFKGTFLESAVVFKLSTFWLDPARLLVSISRATDGTWIFGCARTMKSAWEMAPKSADESNSGSVLRNLVLFHTNRDSMYTSPYQDQNPRIQAALPPGRLEEMTAYMNRYDPKLHLEWVEKHKKAATVNRGKELASKEAHSKTRKFTYNGNLVPKTQMAPSQLAQESAERQADGIAWDRRARKKNLKKAGGKRTQEDASVTGDEPPAKKGTQPPGASDCA